MKSDFFEQLSNYLGEAVFTVKLPERVLSYTNPACETVFGLSSEESLGMSTEMFYQCKKEYLRFGEQLKEAIEQKQQPLRTTQILKRKNGEVFPA